MHDGNDHAANGGAGLGFLAEESSSPTRARLLAQLQARFPRAIWAEYEPVSDEAPAEAAPASAPAGEHTMPDGTKMQGDGHKDHDH